ncbi:hypothetical protein IP70_11095 [alpha proteobacterium AAP38]|nr:hypothetical protein IP70_11095 [alpha proteobacterium AAP38]
MRQYQQFIGGVWRDGAGPGETDVLSPASGDVVGRIRHAGIQDLADATAAAARGFAQWSRTSPLDRSRILRRAADGLRIRTEEIAALIVTEQGKPPLEARTEVAACADVIEWFAEEGRRTYGRVIPGRHPDQHLEVRQVPVGPVAAFTPWNFPLSQAVRKIAPALAAGCAIILKPSEEAPGACVVLADLLIEAGLPGEVLSLVLGDPASISRTLIADPVVRKVSFTGSVPVGKHIAALAGAAMKPCTMELGGHAAVIVAADADPVAAARALLPMKFRNAGQACIAPTRFLIHHSLYDAFVAALLDGAATLNLPPLINPRRAAAVSALVDEAVDRGARLLLGGGPPERCRYPATFLADVPADAAILREEPFGPVATLQRIDSDQEALEIANALPFGLATYLFTDDARRQAYYADRVDCGMLSINAAPIALPETPFGGVRDSGFGREGGMEGLAPYLAPKLVTVHHHRGPRAA